MFAKNVARSGIPPQTRKARIKRLVPAAEN